MEIIPEDIAFSMFVDVLRRNQLKDVAKKFKRPMNETVLAVQKICQNYKSPPFIINPDWTVTYTEASKDWIWPLEKLNLALRDCANSQQNRLSEENVAIMFTDLKLEIIVDRLESLIDEQGIALNHAFLFPNAQSVDACSCFVYEGNIGNTFGHRFNETHDSEEIFKVSYGLYASKDYLNNSNTISNFSDLKNHRCVKWFSQKMPCLESEVWADLFYKKEEKADFNLFKNTISRVCSFVRKSMGIGLLPNYVACEYDDIQQILQDECHVENIPLYFCWKKNVPNTYSSRIILEKIKELTTHLRYE